MDTYDCHPSPCMSTQLHVSLLPLPLSPTYNTLPLSSPFSSSKISVPKMVINDAKGNLPFFLCCCIFCLCVALTLVAAQEDPELQQCKHQCRVQQQVTERQRRECEQKCEDYYREHHGPVVDPEKQLQQCRKQCELLQPGRQRKQCHRECQQKYDQQQLEEGGEEEEEDNPYVFQDQHFAFLRTNQGEVKILEMFDQRSRLLRGLENYRFICLEANPQTFAVPTHYDAEIVGFVAWGQGTITMVCQGKRRSFCIRTGDIVRIPAGTTVHLINSHKNQKLRIAYFLLPVGIPGRFEPFHGAAGENPQSFYRAFSPKLLSSAFKVEEGTLERVFQQQTKGHFIKASGEQIRALSGGQHGKAAGIRPFTSGGSKRPVFNLLNKEPSVCNNYGRLHEASAEDLRQLKDMDIEISYANITREGMMGPFFNSRSTMVAAVVEGEGYLEMACPHLSGEKQQQQGASPVYQKVSSSLHRGTVFVVPTGHPIAIVAGTNRNLEIVCFGINAENNRKEPLAGKGNVVNGLEKEAKELAFSLPGREVDKVFKKQKGELFFSGPQQQKQQHHHRHKGHAYA